MPRKVTPISKSQLRIHAFRPVRRFDAERLALTWEQASYPLSPDRELMALVAARPELGGDTLRRALDGRDPATRMSLACRPDVQVHRHSGLIYDSHDWAVARASLRSSGWDPDVRATAFWLIEQMQGPARGTALDWVWENAPEGELSPERCLMVLRSRVGRLGRLESTVPDAELRRALDFTCRLRPRELAELLAEDVAAGGQSWPGLLLFAVKLDQQIVDWAWEQAAGDPFLERVVASAAWGQRGVAVRRLADGSTAPQVGFGEREQALHDELANRGWAHSSTRQPGLNWAWMARSAHHRLYSEVKSWVRHTYIDSGKDLEVLAKMLRGDFAALVHLVGELGWAELLPLLRVVDDESLRGLPPRVRMPAREPGLADLKALGANEFVLSRWAAVAPTNVVRRDGWDRVAPGALQDVLRGLTVDEMGASFAADVLDQGPPDGVVGLLPAGLFGRLRGHERMVRWVRENVPSGGEELLAQLSDGPAAAVDLGLVLEAVKLVVASPQWVAVESPS